MIINVITNYCRDGGYLVNSARSVPADPTEFYPLGYPVIVGCNRLRCWKCGKTVRNVEHAALAQAPASIPALYRAPNVMAFTGVERHTSARLYLCECETWEEFSDPDLPDLLRDEPSRPGPPWRCAGHPAFAVPFDFHAVRITQDLDWQALVIGALTRPGQGALWLATLYCRLLWSTNKDLALKLSRLIAESMVHVDAVTRSTVMGFFSIHPFATGSTIVLEAIAQHRAWLSEPILKEGYVRLLIRYVLQGDRRAIELARTELEQRPGAATDQLLIHLARHDHDWLAEHATALVQAAPARFEAVLDALERVGSEKVGEISAEIVARQLVDGQELRRFAKKLRRKDSRRILENPPKALHFHGPDRSGTNAAEVLVEQIDGNDHQVTVDTNGLFEPRVFYARLRGGKIVGELAADFGVGIYLEVARIDGKPTAKLGVTEPARSNDECETFQFTLGAK